MDAVAEIDAVLVRCGRPLTWAELRRAVNALFGRVPHDFDRAAVGQAAWTFDTATARFCTDADRRGAWLVRRFGLDD
jgi:hypothetical protein